MLILGLAARMAWPASLLRVAVAETLLALPTQFMVFMRTDLYFVLQDLTRCANLYADGSAYLRLSRAARSSGVVGPDPDPAGTTRRRSAARSACTAWSCSPGPPICLGVEFAVSLPALIPLLVRTVAEIGTTALGTLTGRSC